MWPLHRLRAADDGREAHPATLEGGTLLGPQLAHRGDGLAQEREPIGKVRCEELHLFAQPAGADAEEDPAAGESIEGSDLQRGLQRVTLRSETDAGADPDARGPGRGSH